MRNAELDEAQARIKFARRNINNLKYADDTTLMAESKEELKSLLMKVKVESEKVGLNLNVQKTKIMVFGPITSLQIDGETVETVSDFIFWAPKSLQMVTAAMKLKDTPWTKSYDQPKQQIKNQRHYFANKVPSSQSYGFFSSHVWMYPRSSGCTGAGGPRGATPHSRSGGAAVRRYPTSKVRSSSCALVEQQ